MTQFISRKMDFIAPQIRLDLMHTFLVFCINCDVPVAIGWGSLGFKFENEIKISETFNRISKNEIIY